MGRMKLALKAAAAATLLFLAPLAVQDAAGQSGARSSGACSPVFVQSTVTGNVTVTGCGSNSAEAKRIAAQLTALSRANRADTARLIESLNRLHQADELQLSVLLRILSILEGGAPPQSRLREANDLAVTVLSCTVQQVGPLTVYLREMEVSRGTVSFYFDVMNEGVTEVRQTFFGGGGFNNGGSGLRVRGQRILASEVDIGGDVRRGAAEAIFIPGVATRGRVSFFGVHADPEEIEAFELAYSYRNLRPRGALYFRLNCT